MSAVVFMLRGVNVGGHRPLKMAKLQGLCEGLGFSGVRTYLNSGNAVCRAPAGSAERHARALERRIGEECGFDADVAARTGRAMARIVAANPLAALPGVDPRFLHVTFIIEPPARMTLAGTKLPLLAGERAVLAGGVLYLHCPGGYGNSKLNNTFFEKELGVRSTTRNWQTTTELARMSAAS